MDDNRNFRSYYYEKVGFRGVEEKKSLDILLKEMPAIDVTKLCSFCLRFTLPSVYREYVWKILLGILPPVVQLHEEVWSVRQHMFKDLHHSLEVMRVIDSNTPFPLLIVKMLLLERGKLHCFQQISAQTDSELQNLLAIARVLTKMYPSEETAFWLLRNFTKHLQEVQSALPSQTFIPELLESIVQKDDPELHEHLQALQAYRVLPIAKWMARCYSEVLNQACLERIWDKVIGGSSKILAFVGAAMLMMLRRTLLEMTTTEEIANHVIKIPGDTADMVVNKALDLWISQQGQQR